MCVGRRNARCSRCRGLLARDGHFCRIEFKTLSLIKNLFCAGCSVLLLKDKKCQICSIECSRENSGIEIDPIVAQNLLQHRANSPTGHVLNLRPLYPGVIIEACDVQIICMILASEALGGDPQRFEEYLGRFLSSSQGHLARDGAFYLAVCKTQQAWPYELLKKFGLDPNNQHSEAIFMSLVFHELWESLLVYLDSGTSITYQTLLHAEASNSLLSPMILLHERLLQGFCHQPHLKERSKNRFRCNCRQDKRVWILKDTTLGEAAGALARYASPREDALGRALYQGSLCGNQAVCEWALQQQGPGFTPVQPEIILNAIYSGNRALVSSLVRLNKGILGSSEEHVIAAYFSKTAELLSDLFRVFEFRLQDAARFFVYAIVLHRIHHATLILDRFPSAKHQRFKHQSLVEIAISNCFWDGVQLLLERGASFPTSKYPPLPLSHPCLSCLPSFRHNLSICKICKFKVRASELAGHPIDSEVGHWFHLSCIRRLIRQSAQCPVCSAPFWANKFF